ncbi:MAG: DUF3365 domain-containing protein [Candidatus Brocadiaceae bacterium]|nr:DUF3365 domain-containing protein [Candidatus Brocadiaceae bacterium]
MKNTVSIIILFSILILLVKSDSAVAKNPWKKDFIRPEDIATERSAEKAIARARLALDEVDILHKAYITLITENFTTGPSLLNAVTITEKVFEVMEKEGKYRAKILSTSEISFLPESAPQDVFERNAIDAILSGKSYYERVFFDYDDNGQDFLRAATPIRITTEKCLLCHPHKKVGDLMGVISYTVPLEKYYQ